LDETDPITVGEIVSLSVYVPGELTTVDALVVGDNATLSIKSFVIAADTVTLTEIATGLVYHPLGDLLITHTRARTLGLSAIPANLPTTTVCKNLGRTVESVNLPTTTDVDMDNTVEKT
jgi:hypothetical protein